MNRLKSLLLLALCLLPSCLAAPAVVAECPIQLDSIDPEVGALVLRLNAGVPLSLPVEIRQVPLLHLGLLGQARQDPEGRGYMILLDESLTPLEQHMVILHEWAHLVVWDRGWEPGEDAHGPDWGRASAEVFAAR